MSFPSENNPQMTCADFEKRFDEYVDGTLEAAMAESCSGHLAICPPCDREVTRWQQTRILLSTAVADFATAVNVSGVRASVLAALDLAADSATERRQSSLREAAVDRGDGARRSASRGASRTDSKPKRFGRFSAVLRFSSAATASASIAAAAVLMLSPARQVATDAVVASKSSSRSSMVTAKGLRPSVFAATLGDHFEPASYTPPPLAKPEPSHVEVLEGGPGHTVSTWLQPRTNTRVIWVQNSGEGAPIVTAGLER